MRNILYILLIITLTTLSCKAQSPIIPMENEQIDDNYEDIENSYLKDVNHKYDPFFGEWKWEEGNSSFTIVFYKIEMVYSNFSKTYSDVLVGKYQFIKDGAELMNTLDLGYTINADNFWKNTAVMIHSHGYTTDTKVPFGFYDEVKMISSRARIELLSPLNSNGTLAGSQIRWQSAKGDGPFIDIPFVDYLTLPTNVILVKQ